MGMSKEMIKRDAKFCWMPSTFLASIDITEFQITEAYYSLY
jgi:hypothetical protein